MASAYGTIANGGVYIEPKLYTKVLDKNQSVLLEKKSTVRDVMSKQNAFILTSMMKDVVTGAEGTARVTKIANIDTAGKTGTTSSSKDRWYTGFTPYYVGSVWVGYDIQQTISTSVNPSAALWKAVMQKVHEGLPAKSFTMPSGVVQIEVCKDSGLLPTDLCRHDRRGDRTYTEYFSVSNKPTTYCTTHVKATVCPDSFKLPNPVCINTAGTVDIVCLNRNYEKIPSRLPEDYAYEVPSTYCTFHYCPQDENGNWIYNISNGNNDNNNNDNNEDDENNNSDNNSTENNNDTHDLLNDGGFIWWKPR